MEIFSGHSKLGAVNPELGSTRGRATQANEGEGGEGSTGEGLRGLPEEDRAGTRSALLGAGAEVAREGLVGVCVRPAAEGGLGRAPNGDPPTAADPLTSPSACSFLNGVWVYDWAVPRPPFYN